MFLVPLVGSRRCRLALLALSLAIGCSRQDAPEPTAGGSLKWRYSSEQVWLVAETLQNLKGLADYAHDETPPAGDPADLEVKESMASLEEASFHIKFGNDEPFPLVVKEYVFSPAAYEATALAWLGGAQASPAEDDHGLPKRLLDLRLATLQAASTDVSASLTRSPRSPRAHDDAAFVLAAFGLRESAAGHTDPRRLLARIAAHLTMARALRKGAPPSSTGRLAGIAAAVLAGRTADAATRLESSAAGWQTDAEKTWARALRLFATQNWREVSWSDSLSLAERIAWFRAYQARVGSDRAYLFLEQLPPDERSLPDWGRIRLTAWPSVRDCHAFAVGGAQFDLQEASDAARLFRGAPLEGAALLAALNEEAGASPVRGGREPRVEVLEWGIVAAFLQRHIGARLSYEAGCYERTFGQPEAMPKVRAHQEALFGRLILFPLDAERWTKTAAAQKRMAMAALRVIQEKPHLVTAHLWSILNSVPPFADPVGIPPATLWFRPLMPLGTVFPGSGRLYASSAPRNVSVELYQILIRLNPYDTDLPWGAASRRGRGRKPTYEEMRDSLGPAFEWDVLANRSLATLAEGRPAEQRPLLTKVCVLDADACGQLGELLIGVDETEAAEVFLRFWREGMDRVDVANRIEWLVEYERKRGRMSRAFEIARDAAQTYSANGLLTLARLAEKTGRLDEAEANFRASADRYDMPSDLYYFYDRQVKAGKRRYESARIEIEKQIFPHGLEKLESLPTEKPMDGVVMSALEEGAERAGFRHGDVIVALDDVRVHSRPQWVFLRDRTKEPSMVVVIYRAGSYREIRCRFDNRIIPAWIENYPKAR